MLGRKDAVANIAVKDLETARKFYEETLGLKKVNAEDEELIVFKSGKTMLNVYRSKYAGTNQATAVTWAVGDVDGAVRDLKAKGVSFKVAWFKDPDGNILNIVSS